ncbi:DUF1838 domain-containing protein [Parahaliea maris]|uniref:DUF1838 domain-containing protein n=1 Tax=Parahaliea maris TaxID=2716870 RepID=A0A5C8ZWY3_9GAMM|nr:DUF1838 family protein [Parahaliea maris]TXS91987.1 DUF1838 domain-containing protein [Parahaliea maris]
MADTYKVSRRGVLGGALGAGALAAAGLAIPPATAASSKYASLNLEDPKQRSWARAKVIGAVEPQLVYTFYRLHLYGYMHGGNLVPFFTMNNLNITRWTPLENGNYRSVGAECGIYCKFDTDEVLDVWENPITGEKRKVWDFLGGPMTVELGPDGIITSGAVELSPEVMRMEVMGDKLFVPTAAHMSVPNPFPPAKWPKGSTEENRYWDSMLVAAADMDEVLNPDIAMANSFLQFQNLGSWHPWLGLGGEVGRTYGRAYGTKYTSLDDMPPGVVAGIEKRVPDIFDFESWEEPRVEMLDYMKANKPE